MCVSDETIELAADEIRAANRRRTLEFVEDVGRIVLDRFYGGSEEYWRAKGPKDVALARLADRLGSDPHLGPSRLSRCVATHVLLRSYPEIRELQGVTPTHIRLVLPLPPDDGLALLHRAEVEKWPARELERHLRERRGPLTSRARTPVYVGALSKLVQLVRSGALFEETERATELDEATRCEHFEALMEARESLDKLQRLLNPKRWSQRGPPIHDSLGHPIGTKSHVKGGPDVQRRDDDRRA